MSGLQQIHPLIPFGFGGEDEVGKVGVTLFVYGTLMRGEPNHDLLGVAEFLGFDFAPETDLFSMDAFPVLRPGSGRVFGEVWRVDSSRLALLDQVEGHPHVYKRVSLPLASGRIVWGYVGTPELADGLPVISSGNWKTRFKPNQAVFIYGSNLFPPRLGERCPNWDGTFSRARLHDWSLKFNKRLSTECCAASIGAEPGGLVRGVVVHLNDTNLHMLDLFEGVPVHYERVRVVVNLDDGDEPSHVWTYLAKPEMIEMNPEKAAPRTDYLDLVLAGARAVGLETPYVDELARLGRTESKATHASIN